MAIKKFNANSVSGGLVSGATVSSSAPSAPSNGALWLNSSTGALLTYYDSGSNTQWLQPVSPTGAVGATGAAGAAGEAGVSVVISSIVLTDSSYATITDTSLSLTGGYIRILGTGFVSGCTVVIDNSVATSVTFVNSTEIRAQLPAKVAGTYILYVSNPSGAVAIRVNAITFSATPSWVTTSPLSGSINVPVSIQLSVASDSTVSYVLQAGSTLPTGLTLSSSGLLSGTVTGITLLTTYNFTIVATDLESQTSPKAFSITISVSEPYFNSTVLLLQGDVTPFTADASTNKFEISPVGTPSANTNNPLQPGYYSGSFNGSSDKLTFPLNTSNQFGTGDFTVELWSYIRSQTGAGLVNNYTTLGSGSFGIFAGHGAANTTKYQVAYGSTGFPNIQSTTSISYNQWVHIAVVRSGTTITFYINGVVNGTLTGASGTLNGSGNWTVGTAGDSPTGYYVNAYLSNLRIVKGVAVYTGAFTPPTAPLQATQISGTNVAEITGTATSLLTCQSYRFIDNSSTPQTITVSGTPNISITQPFTLPAPYTGYGSGLFTGSSYLTVPSNAAFGFGTGDFTIETWLYWTGGSNENTLFCVDVSGGLNLFLSSSSAWGIGQRSVAVNNSFGTPPVQNIWNHIAVSRSGSTVYAFINGALVYSGANTINYATGPAGIAAIITLDTTYIMTGYVSNFRVVKSVAVYTGAFTPPTGPLTATQSSSGNIAAITGTATSLLTLQTNQAQNNNQFRDSSTNNFAITRTGTPTQGIFTPFSQTGWSVYLASQQYIYTPANTTFDITAVDFTVECWVYFIAYNGMQFSGGVAVSTYMSGGGWAAGFEGQNGLSGINFSTYNAGATTKTITAASINSSNLTLNSWHHVAWVQRGANFYFFLDGVSYNTTTALSAGERGGVGGQLSIGVWAASMTYSGNPNWYLSNMRIVKGVAVYTGNFTPPTAPLTATQSGSGNIAAITGTATSLLTLQRNRFIDNIATPNIFAVSGTPSIQSFSPFAPSAAYSAATVGGGIYFNGGTDRLTTPSDSSFAFGTGDFTVEFWIYALGWNASDYNALCTFSTGSIGMYSYSGGYLNYNNGAGYQISSGIRPVLNQWNHIALCRGSGSSKLYLNGVQVGSTYADTTNFAAGATNVNNATYPTQAYYANFRVVKGTAVYTGAFTPPTAPLTAIAGTSLLLSATNAGIIDATGKNDLVTVGDVRTSTAVIKYGSSSMYFDGTGDCLTVLSSAFFNFGTVDFTIECWVYPITLSTAAAIIDTRNSDILGAWDFNLQSTSKLDFIYGASRLTSTTSISTNVWTHIAVTRASGVIRLFINGVVETTTATYSSAIDALSFPSIGGGRSTGANSVTGYYLNGYLDDLRVTKGIARYTTTFTPPSQAMLGM